MLELARCIPIRGENSGDIDVVARFATAEQRSDLRSHGVFLAQAVDEPVGLEGVAAGQDKTVRGKSAQAFLSKPLL